MIKETAYLETSVVSYLNSFPSRDLIVAAHQQITHDWWRLHAPNFTIVVSTHVLLESARGDPKMAAARTSFLAGIPVLEETLEMLELAEEYQSILRLPKSKMADAHHLAAASWHGIDYLVTWNCKHIASAQVRRALYKINVAAGLKVPILCTPEELEK
ncbi:MAG: type II toxin-antitoxin system VapC family toxin [Planctomycetota bacterium]